MRKNNNNNNNNCQAVRTRKIKVWQVLNNAQTKLVNKHSNVSYTFPAVLMKIFGRSKPWDQFCKSQFKLWETAVDLVFIAKISPAN